MPGQAVVTINGKQWSVVVANTLTELQTGLSGVVSIPSQTGILFDLGYDQSQIQINMLQMLFPLDIIFINSTQGVVGVLHNVQPGETDVRFEATTTPGARCFLEVNAGEAEGIVFGDSVNIQGYTRPAQFDISSLFSIMLIALLGFAMFKVIGGALKPSKERPRIPPGRPPARIEEEGLQQKQTRLESAGKEMAREAGVEFLKLEEGWQGKYATPRYWFKDPKGKELIASDLEELKWKLSRLLPQTTEITVEVWQMTKQEWLRYSKAQTEKAGFEWTEESAERQEKWHRQQVRYALAGGLPVPPKVLADYPDLTPIIKVKERVIPVEPRPRREGDLEYLADSPEFLTQTIEAIGYRDKIDNAFQEAIRRAKGLK